MPDHAHLLVKADGDPRIIIKNFKGASARMIFKQLPEIKLDMRTEHFWTRGYHYAEVNDDNKIKSYIDYIVNNPVKKNLLENEFYVYVWEPQSGQYFPLVINLVSQTWHLRNHRESLLCPTSSINKTTVIAIVVPVKNSCLIQFALSANPFSVNQFATTRIFPKRRIPAINPITKIFLKPNLIIQPFQIS